MNFIFLKHYSEISLLYQAVFTVFTLMMVFLMLLLQLSPFHPTTKNIYIWLARGFLMTRIFCCMKISLMKPPITQSQSQIRSFISFYSQSSNCLQYQISKQNGYKQEKLVKTRNVFAANTILVFQRHYMNVSYKICFCISNKLS